MTEEEAENLKWPYAPSADLPQMIVLIMGDNEGFFPDLIVILN